MNLDEIVSSDLRAFLKLLEDECISDVVVVGGAVRDTLVHRVPRDIDVAARLSVDSPASALDGSLPKSHEHVVEWHRALSAVARLLGAPNESLSDPIPFRQSTIDILGLERVCDRDGCAFPDIFVDCRDRLFSARPELTVNRMMLGAEGRVWPKAAVEDMEGRLARFGSSPLGLQLRQLVRALKTCGEHALTLVPEAQATMLRHLESLGDHARFETEFRVEDTARLIRGLLEDPHLDPGADHHRILDALRALTRPRSCG